MITIKRLLEGGFFKEIHKIKELSGLCGIINIYVIPPIASDEDLYLMVTTKLTDEIEKFFQFSNAIKDLFKSSFDVHIYKKNGMEEAISEDSVFSEEYQNALNSCILIDKLNQKMPLDLQWNKAKEAKMFTQNSKNKLTTRKSFTPTYKEKIKKLTYGAKFSNSTSLKTKTKTRKKMTT